MTHTAKHTPGPWHLSECATQTTKAGVCSESGLHITDVNGYGMTDAQNQANAALIAAAPAMYEALQSLTSEIDLSKLNIRKDFSLMNAHACAVKAILQAEGKLL